MATLPEDFEQQMQNAAVAAAMVTGPTPIDGVITNRPHTRDIAKLRTLNTEAQSKPVPLTNRFYQRKLRELTISAALNQAAGNNIADNTANPAPSLAEQAMGIVQAQRNSFDHNTRDLARIVQVMDRSPRGAHLLNVLERTDYRLGGLGPGPNFGYSLSKDRAIYVQSSVISTGLRILAHEARHAEQIASGYSTGFEYYRPGTQLPFDGGSYLKMNRVLEADADAYSLSVLWEVSRDPNLGYVWNDLKNDAHFKPMAEAFEQAVAASNQPETSDAAVRAGTAAVFNTWFSVGEPKRSRGYDAYIMQWLESTANDKIVGAIGTIQTERRFTSADMERITSLGAEAPYWRPAENKRTLLQIGQYDDDIKLRLTELNKTIIPAASPKPAFDAQSGVAVSLSAWRSRHATPARTRTHAPEMTEPPDAIRLASGPNARTLQHPDARPQQQQILALSSPAITAQPAPPPALVH